MKKICLILLLLVFVTLSTKAEDSKDPIVIPLHNWSSQIVGAHVMGQILERNGNNVEYQPFDSHAVFDNMCKGTAHIIHETWDVFAKSFYEKVEKGCIEIAALHDAYGEEGWWVPKFTIDMCPDLPNYKALNRCSALKGVFIDGPKEWHGNEYKKLINNLNLNFKIKYVNSASGLWEALYKAKRNNEAIVMFNWSPNFPDGEFDGRMIEFPDQYRKRSQFKTLVWKGFKNKWPDAYKVLKIINFSAMDISKMAYFVDSENMSHDEAANRWLLNNKDKVDHWLDNTSKWITKKKSKEDEQKEKATKEAAAKEKARLEKKAKERAAKEKARKEKAAKEKAELNKTYDPNEINKERLKDLKWLFDEGLINEQEYKQKKKEILDQL